MSAVWELSAVKHVWFFFNSNPGELTFPLKDAQQSDDMIRKCPYREPQRSPQSSLHHERRCQRKSGDGQRLYAVWYSLGALTGRCRTGDHMLRCFQPIRGVESPGRAVTHTAPLITNRGKILPVCTSHLSAREKVRCRGGGRVVSRLSAPTWWRRRVNQTPSFLFQLIRN